MILIAKTHCPHDIIIFSNQCKIHFHVSDKNRFELGDAKVPLLKKMILSDQDVKVRVLIETSWDTSYLITSNILLEVFPKCGKIHDCWLFGSTGYGNSFTDGLHLQSIRPW